MDRRFFLEMLMSLPIIGFTRKVPKSPEEALPKAHASGGQSASSPRYMSSSSRFRGNDLVETREYTLEDGGVVYREVLVYRRGPDGRWWLAERTVNIQRQGDDR